MPLRFPGAWRFTPPADGDFINASMPASAVGEFFDVIDKLRNDKSRWWMLEHFESYFGASSRSSTESWAYSDLMSAMAHAAANAPMFIESFYDACEELRNDSDEWFVPDVSFFNAILAKHNVGYVDSPPDLLARELGGPLIAVPQPSPTMAERARETLERSLKRSEELLVRRAPQRGGSRGSLASGDGFDCVPRT